MSDTPQQWEHEGPPDVGAPAPPPWLRRSCEPGREKPRVWSVCRSGGAVRTVCLVVGRRPPHSSAGLSMNRGMPPTWPRSPRAPPARARRAATRRHSPTRGRQARRFTRHSRMPPTMAASRPRGKTARRRLSRALSPPPRQARLRWVRPVQVLDHQHPSDAQRGSPATHSTSSVCWRANPWAICGRGTGADAQREQRRERGTPTAFDSAAASPARLADLCVVSARAERPTLARARARQDRGGSGAKREHDPTCALAAARSTRSGQARLPDSGPPAATTCGSPARARSPDRGKTGAFLVATDGAQIRSAAALLPARRAALAHDAESRDRTREPLSVSSPRGSYEVPP